MQRLIAILIILILLCPYHPASGNQAPGGAVHYDIKISPALAVLAIRICFGESVPEYLYPVADRTSDYLLQVRVRRQLLADEYLQDGRIGLQTVEPGDCIEFDQDLAAMRKRSKARRSGNSDNLNADNVILPLSTWLWLPEQQATTGEIYINFHHQPGLGVSMPWELLDRSDTVSRYRYVDTPATWKALTAFGRIHTENINVPGSDLRLAILDGEPRVDVAMVRQWIEYGAHAMTLVYGEFPLPSPQILVIPTGKHERGAVPWGQVLRGGGTSSHLFIDQTSSVHELVSDWTLVHELSHMLHPYLGRNGSWLAEGLASYYQNLLQARSGIITPQRAWEKLHAGFERGKRQTIPGVLLQDASSGKAGRRYTMRVYWSGAAIALLADVRLRRQQQSLDFAMAAFRQCCLPANRRWSTREFMLKLDELTATAVFSDLHEQYVYADEFPRLIEVYHDLGITLNGNQLLFSNKNRLREAIMSAQVTAGQSGRNLPFIAGRSE